MDLNEIARLGFYEVYNYPYSHATTLSEILSIRGQCFSTTIMCVGGGNPSSGVLNVVACANCLAITTETPINSPKYNGLAFWYLSQKLSFGFSPSPNIAQNQADTLNNNITDSNLRLSWHVDLGTGGWRLGVITGLNNNELYNKKIFLKNPGQTTTRPPSTTPTTITTTVTAPLITTPQIPFHLTKEILTSWNYTFKERQVDLSNLNIGSIEGGLFGQFIYLEKLILKNNKILRLYSNTFKNMPYLKYLDFSNNRLSSLIKGDFDGAPNVETLYLNGNLLQHVALDTFIDMKNLNTYSFANNPITQFYTLTITDGILTTISSGTISG